MDIYDIDSYNTVQNMWNSVLAQNHVKSSHILLQVIIMVVR